jgi:large repetitive protein
LIRQFLSRLVQVAALSATLGGLGACSSSHNATPSTAVGIGVGLSSSGSTSLTPGGSVTLTATVYNDSASQGVTWTLSGLGTLSGKTKTQVTYTAPSSLNGVASATITALSVADTTKYANATVVTNGAPVLQPSSSLPANQNVGYSTGISVQGGVAPYSWLVVAGQLPPGLVLGSSNGSIVAISGTPTAVGTWNFTIQVTDSNSRVDKRAYTLIVNPQPSCLLIGTYAYKLNGFSKNGVPAVRAGTFSVNSNGDVTGIQDVKSDLGTTIGQQVTSGKCHNQIGNRGDITFVSSTGTLVFNWALFTALDEGFMQELDSSGIAGTANFARIDTAASLADHYALGMVGSDASAVRLGVAAQIAVSPAGQITSGTIDDTGALGYRSTAVTGSMTAPGAADAFGITAPGRGTLTLTANGTSHRFVYYAVSGSANGRRLFVMSADPSGGPVLVGDLRPQLGPFGLQSLAPAAATTPTVQAEVPAIFEYVSATGTHYPTTRVGLGRLDAADPVKKTVGFVLDTASGTSVTYDSPYTASYDVSSTGRVTFSFGSGASAQTFAGYLYGTSAGYLVETTAGNAGGYALLEPQHDFPFTQFPGGVFIGTTVLPGTISPLSLLPTQTVQAGAFGGNMSGQYALDATTGRGLGQVSRSLFGGTGLIFYIVDNTKIVLMGNGANAINPMLGWLDY